MISMRCRTIKDLRRVYKEMKDTVEVGKAKQEELGREVTALGVKLVQLQDLLASNEYVLTVKEAI